MTVHTARLTVIQLMTCVRLDPNVKANTAAISVPTRIELEEPIREYHIVPIFFLIGFLFRRCCYTFFSFLAACHFAYCLKEKPSNRTKIRFPANAVTPTANGCNPMRYQVVQRLIHPSMGQKLKEITLHIAIMHPHFEPTPPYCFIPFVKYDLK